MYRALYRKWRPQRFEDVVGQRAIVTALKNQITAGRIGHAYLFTGVRGTGKTTCAKIFAKAVNCLHPVNGDPCGECEICRGIDNGSILDVVEMDEIIAKRNGMSISEIFELHGEEYFRNEETAFLRESREKKNMIVSCGGGVPMRQVNVDEMKKSGKVVLLTANPETILEHVKHSHDRPLLENNKNVDYIAELMEKRREAYEAAADIVIATDGKSVYDICEEIITKVNA